MSAAATTTAYPAIQPGLSIEQIETLLRENFALVRDPRDRWHLTMIVPAAKLVEVVTFLRNEATLAFAQLLDIAGIDYLAYPNHRERGLPPSTISRACSSSTVCF